MKPGLKHFLGWGIHSLLQVIQALPPAKEAEILWKAVHLWPAQVPIPAGWDALPEVPDSLTWTQTQSRKVVWTVLLWCWIKFQQISANISQKSRWDKAWAISPKIIPGTSDSQLCILSHSFLDFTGVRGNLGVTDSSLVAFSRESFLLLQFKTSQPQEIFLAQNNHNPPLETMQQCFKISSKHSNPDWKIPPRTMVLLNPACVFFESRAAFEII